MFSIRSVQPVKPITGACHLLPEAALEKALAQPESAAALDNTLLKNAFLDAAKNERFQTAYFKEFEKTERYTFRERLRQDEVFQHFLSQRFKHDIANQQKISKQPDTFWEQMKLSPTVNQDERGSVDMQITHIILHHTVTNSAAKAVKIMADRNVSSHYLIDRDGDLICLVPDNYRAWHAGVSKWQGVENVNFCSIGIELVNNGFEPFPNEQINRLLELLEDLKDRHAIPIENFISHADISPGRKVDPNWFFPWDLLGDKGFGLWLKPEERQSELPENFDTADALTTLGYRVEPLMDAIQAFNLHYLGHKEKFELDEEGKLTLHSLAVKVSGRVEDTALHVKALRINDFA
ncbi:N-acetylmuramoyl-L-alanine amidase [Mycoavidus sp. SF9855]|uniref:N-acetylmuramoyl-L-alanine amidase n=1 Tax=Mycoavidus sp. SF9855 TaxID=2968475 RepID=UPI00211C2743|nr:N-acetylmuramoyl-L-alanine amidase [Mycoavidus sp. SF9855]UUM21495.1 N-acetylmuramoyl-L-alanine amidase [Mycoavidus sp. SF9855]